MRKRPALEQQPGLRRSCGGSCWNCCRELAAPGRRNNVRADIGAHTTLMDWRHQPSATAGASAPSLLVSFKFMVTAMLSSAASVRQAVGNWVYLCLRGGHQVLETRVGLPSSCGGRWKAKTPVSSPGPPKLSSPSGHTDGQLLPCALGPNFG